jgi:hypothetical protein
MAELDLYNCLIKCTIKDYTGATNTINYILKCLPSLDLSSVDKNLFMSTISTFIAPATLINMHIFNRNDLIPLDPSHKLFNLVHTQVDKIKLLKENLVTHKQNYETQKNANDKIKEKVKKIISTANEVICLLEQLINVCEKFIYRVCEKSSTSLIKERQAAILGITPYSACYIDMKLAHKILNMDENDFIQEKQSLQQQFSNHIVVRHHIENEECVFFKLNRGTVFSPRETFDGIKCPIIMELGAPALQHAYDEFYAICSGQPGATTLLLKMQIGTSSYHLQASKAIKGEQLFNFITQHRENLSKIKINNLEAVFITNMMLMPSDAKPQNYIARIDREQKDGLPEISIISVDSDAILCNPIYKTCTGHYVLNYRDILGLLPQVLNKLSPEFTERFLKMTPEEIILTWLDSLMNRNKYYNDLLQYYVFDESEMRDLNLPLKLPPKILDLMFEKLCGIQTYMKDNPNCNLNDLFHHVMPLEAEYYAHIRSNMKRPEEEIIYQIKSRIPEIQQSIDQLNAHFLELADKANSTIGIKI